MFGCGSDTRLPNDPESLAAAPDGEEFGLVHRVCYHLLRRLHGSRDGAIVAPNFVACTHYFGERNHHVPLRLLSSDGDTLDDTAGLFQDYDSDICTCATDALIWSALLVLAGRCDENPS